MLFVTAAGPFLLPANTTEGSSFSAALPTLVIFVVFLIAAVPKRVRWYLLVVFICSSPDDE